MSATFTYAARYAVTAVCRTPLRTGGADGDAETVLRDGEGRAFLQGTSLAGALRDWLESEDSEPAEGLLGSPQKSGRLIVSDARFDPNPEQYIRPRLRVDPGTGAAAGGAKFDVAHIGAGASFRFSLTWLGEKQFESELETVERMLAALDSGEIRLGAQRSNGFGRVELTVTKQTFDMRDRQDREAWLSDDETYKCAAVELPKAAGRRRVAFTVTGRMDSVLIRAAYAEQTDGGSYTPNLTEGKPVLPGSSVKGAVRARAEAIAGMAGLDKEWFQTLFGRGAKDGDGGKPGQVWFEDAVLNGGTRKITRIRIDKFTGGVIRGGLFREEPAGGEVTLRVSAPDDPVACALILYALRDLVMGLYNLGGGGSIGRGYIAAGEDGRSAWRIEAAAPDGRTVELAFDGPLSCSLNERDGLAAEWLKAWGGAIHET